MMWKVAQIDSLVFDGSDRFHDFRVGKSISVDTLTAKHQTADAKLATSWWT